MDAAYIRPFIASIQNVFSTMMQLPVQVKEPRIKAGSAGEYDISGIIGMSGDVVGSVVLSFPNDTAQRVVALFCGQPLAIGTPDFADAIGELVNMVSGGAKGMFTGKKVSISCPSVVVGSKHHIARQSDTPCIVIPCSTDCGELVIEIAIKETSATPTKPAAVAAKA
jgi:chemotaxis protein CheX